MYHKVRMIEMKSLFDISKKRRQKLKFALALMMIKRNTTYYLLLCT